MKIISPPHALLAAGIGAVGLGSLLLVLGSMNRAEGAARVRLERVFLYIGSVLLCFNMVFTLERTDRTEMHAPMFYRDVAVVVPLILVGIGRASGRRWGATQVAIVYSLFNLALLHRPPGAEAPADGGRALGALRRRGQPRGPRRDRGDRDRSPRDRRHAARRRRLDGRSAAGGPGRIVRVGNEPLRARVPARLSFLVEDENGKPAFDMELYMACSGMPRC